METVTTSGGERKIVKRAPPVDGSGMQMQFSPDGRYFAYDHTQKPGASERDISLISLTAPGRFTWSNTPPMIG